MDGRRITQFRNMGVEQLGYSYFPLPFLKSAFWYSGLSNDLQVISMWMHKILSISYDFIFHLTDNESMKLLSCPHSLCFIDYHKTTAVSECLDNSVIAITRIGVGRFRILFLAKEKGALQLLLHRMARFRYWDSKFDFC